MLDTAAPGVYAGIGIKVWGDFFNRSHYGPLVEKAAHKWFPLATFGSDLKIHYAAFFYEFLLCVAVIVLYYVLFRKKILKKANRFLLMTLIYCLGRFCIDSIRQDMIMAGPIAFDQLCELLLAVLCLLLLFLKWQPPQGTGEDKASVVPSGGEETEQAETAIEKAAEPSEPEGSDGAADAGKETSNPAADQEKPFSGLN